MCELTLTVFVVAERPEVVADTAVWAVCGRSSGVLGTEELRSSKGRTGPTLEVMPLLAGYLPVPSVRLSKYVPAEGSKGQARLQAFPLGQVYNCSRSAHVLTAAQ